jgi:hypothetical protein
MDYIQQRDAALAEINTLIGPNGTGAITGQVHRDNERNQTNDVYANLFAYDQFTFCVVRNGATAAENGANLLAAMTGARSANPNGASKSATNRYTILLPAAVYDMGDTDPLLIDAQFIDIIGLGAPQDVVLTSTITASSSGTVVKLANDVVLQNLTIQNNANNYVSGAPTEAAGYAPQGSYAAEVFRNVIFRNNAGASGSSFILRGQTFAGTYENCIGIDTSNVSVLFDGAASGSRFINCRYTGPAFGYELPFVGTVTACEAGNDSFGYFSIYASGNTWAGTIKDCIGGNNSFGHAANGVNTVVNGCIGGTFCFFHEGRTQSVVMTGCQAGDDSFLREADVASIRLASCLGTNRCFGYLATVTSMEVTGCNALASSFGYDATYSSPSVASVTYTNCYGTDDCFSRVDTIGDASDRAVYNGCTANLRSFSYGRSTIEGLYTNCIGGNECFAFVTALSIVASANARFTNCTAGRWGFFSSNSLVFSGTITVQSTFIGCVGRDDSFGASFSGTATVDFAGTAKSCTSGTASFGVCDGIGIFSGLAVDCHAANYSFGTSPANGTMTGSATDCTAGAFSFGTTRQGGTISSGGRSGDLIRCSCNPRYNAAAVGGGVQSPVTGKMYNCEWGYGVNIGADAILVGGTYEGSFVSVGAVTATIDQVGLTGFIAGTITNTVASPHITVIP